MLKLLFFPFYLFYWMLILPFKLIGWIFKGLGKLFWFVCIGIFLFFG